MAWLPDDENFLKICLFVLTECTNVTDTQTDRQTPHDGIGSACIASRGKNMYLSTAQVQKSGESAAAAARQKRPLHDRRGSTQPI